MPAKSIYSNRRMCGRYLIIRVSQFRTIVYKMTNSKRRNYDLFYAETIQLMLSRILKFGIMIYRKFDVILKTQIFYSGLRGDFH